MHEKDLNTKIPESLSEFLSTFYADALASQMVNIITDKMTFSKEMISDYTFSTLAISLREVIKSSACGNIKADRS
ncbi:MAG: TetR family transcriptional regulator C-terminal domain-containing protein, partial [Oscillospiraceae bacterium]|nr:TetR family transcriptional regulator C-terminal domain-containing protein [Oscillospiraceae bacterium]